MMRKLIRAYRQRRHKLRVRELVVLGENSEIHGVVEKRAKLSRITVGRDCLIEGTLITETDDSLINIGNNVYVGGQTTLDCALGITICDDVLVSYQCLLTDSDNASTSYRIRRNALADWRDGSRHDWNNTASATIEIGKGAWIGVRSIILKGVTIGEGAIVGAGSVVTKNVPAWTIVAGNPARVVRELTLEERAAE